MLHRISQRNSANLLEDMPQDKIRAENKSLVSRHEGYKKAPRMQSTITALRSRVRSLGAPAADGKNIVAFSGGVDSSLVATLVHHVFPGSSQACVGVSSALPTAQLDLARSVARHIGEK